MIKNLNEMKKASKTKMEIVKVILFVMVSISITSCSNDQKAEDTKEIAEDHNDAKFEDNDKERDAQFLVNAAEINLEEISLAQLAQQFGKTEDVKELGKAMEINHAKSLQELTTLAQTKLISIPTAPTANVQEAHKILNSKSSENFDEAYCDMIVKNHKNAISTFEKAANECTDADIKSWANSSLNELRTHQDHAIECKNKSEKM